MQPALTPWILPNPLNQTSTLHESSPSRATPWLLLQIARRHSRAGVDAPAVALAQDPQFHTEPVPPAPDATEPGPIADRDHRPAHHPARSVPARRPAWSPLHD
jgi:hypothetical protein